MVVLRRERESMSRSQILDIQFLREQTAFDRALERELLGLLDQQCETLLPLLAGPDDTVERREAAHSLRGAASALGARRLSAAATAIELRQSPDVAIEEAIAELRAFIRARLVDRAA